MGEERGRRKDLRSIEEEEKEDKRYRNRRNRNDIHTNWREEDKENKNETEHSNNSESFAKMRKSILLLEEKFKKLENMVDKMLRTYDFKIEKIITLLSRILGRREENMNYVNSQVLYSNNEFY